MADTPGFTLQPVEGNPFAGAPAAASPPAADSSAPPSGNFKLEPVSGDPFREPSTSDVVASGLVSGLGARTLGMPADIAEMLPSLTNPTYWRGAAVLGQKLGLFGPETASSLHGVADAIQNAPLTSHWWNEKLSETGLPTTENTRPTTTGGKMLQHGVEGASAFVAPSLAAKVAGIAKLPGVAEAFRELAPGSSLVNAGIGAASGVAGEGAAELYPKSQIARPIAELVTGGLGAAAPAGAAAARQMVPPLMPAARQAAAQRAGIEAFDTAASTPHISDAIEQRLAADNAELLQGSKPTTAELLNDRGLAGLQRSRERLPPINPEEPQPSQSMLGEAVADRRSANNEARVGALNEMAPATASPDAAQDALRRYLDDIDLAHAKWIDYDRQNAERARQPITPALSPEEQGQAARSAVEAERAPAAAALAGEEQAARQNLTRVIEGNGAPAQPQASQPEAMPRQGGAPPARSAAPDAPPPPSASAPESGMFGFEHTPNGKISFVYPGSPAYRAGLQPGDAVTHVNDIPRPTKIREMQAWWDPVTGQRELGVPITLDFEREGQPYRITMQRERMFGDAPPQGVTLPARPAASADDTGIGGREAVGAPEERALAMARYGETMRDPVQQRYLAERKRLNDMRQAIDPDGTMGMRPGAIKSAVDEVKRDFSPDTFGGMESKFYDRVSGWGDLIPLNDAFRLRADINSRLRNVTDHSPQETARLMILKRGVDQAMQDAVADTHVLEQAGTVNQGASSIDQRIGGLADKYGIGPSFAQDVARAYASDPATLRAAGRDEAGRGVLDIANQGNDGIRADSVSGGAGGRSGEGGRFGDSAGDPGIPQNPELTTLTPEARAAFEQWNRDYAAMARDYRGETGGKLHAVGKMLQKGGAYDSFRLADAEVPWLFVNSGKLGREAVDRFLNVTADRPEARQALDDAFAFSLRRAAQREDGTLDLGKYQRWLDGHETALSARPELMERFNTAREAQQRLDDVRQSLAEHEATYPLKPGWGDSGILSQFFKPGPQGAETMRRYLDLTGKRPEAVEAAADYAALKFANQPGIIKDGQINTKAAEAWIGQHDPALSAVPGLKDKFANAIEAQKAVEQAVNRHLQARKEFTESVAGAFIGDDPERAVRRVFTGPDRDQKARALMTLLGDNKAAVEGLQRAAIDHMVREFSGAPLAGSEVRALMPQRMQDFIAENRTVIETLFPNGGAKTFDALAEDLKRSQIVPGAKQPGGSDTAELLGRTRGLFKENSTSGLLWALFGERLGHTVGHLGGPVGVFLGLLGGNYIKAQRGAFQVATNAVLDRMLLDPEFALEMKRLQVTPGPAGDAIRQRLQARLMTSIIQSARSDDLQPDHRRGKFADGGAVITSAAHLHREAQKAHPEPTHAQKEAGNYQKAHIVVQGIPIAIENAKGSWRRGVGPNGKPWQVRMPVPYGYVKQSEGADGDPVDVYVGNALHSPKVFIIDQKDPGGGFDEHKAMIGFPNRGVALANYRRAFSDGKAGERIGGVAEMSIDEFKAWLREGDTTRPLVMHKRADGGAAGAGDDPWRSMTPEGQAKHFTDLTEQFRDRLKQQETAMAVIE